MNPKLLEYVHAVINSKIAELKPLSVLAHESVTTMILHRDAQFQVEMVIGHPKATKWPGEHRHPNVDSVEIALLNCEDFTKNGTIVKGPEFVIQGMGCVYLDHTDWHGVPYKENGFSLLSVQMWLNNTTASSVGLDWDGEPTSDGHKQQLTK